MKTLTAALIIAMFGAPVLAQHDSDSHGGGGTGGYSADHRGYGGGRDHTADGDGRSHDVARGAGRQLENRVLREARPVWAREGIPEVELGRLNVGRAPAFILERAEDKALEEFTATMTEFYSLTAEQAAALLEQHYDDIERIHSPVQNLALYRDVMIFGKTQLPGVNAESVFDLAAIFLGSASDKNISISPDTVIAINRILGLVEMSLEDIATLANKANSVRTSISIGHGDTGHSEPTGH